MSDKKSLVLIDFENVHISLDSIFAKNIKPTEMKIFKETGKKYGDKVSVRAIGNFMKFPEQHTALTTEGITIISTTESTKNSADIALVVECMKSLQDYDSVVIFSGDADFLPLINHVLNEEKELYLYSVSGSTSSNIRNRVGEENHFYIDEVFSDKLADVTDLKEKYVLALKTLYIAIERANGVNFRVFSEFIGRAKKEHGDLSQVEITTLINDLIDLGIVFQEEVPHKKDANKTVKVFKIVYTHPQVKKLKDQGIFGRM